MIKMAQQRVGITLKRFLAK